MWSYVRIPNIDPIGNTGLVCIVKYFVDEGAVIRSGDRIALIQTDDGRFFEIISNYAGRILKTILFENNLVEGSDPIATLELMQDPVDGMLVEHLKLVNYRA